MKILIPYSPHRLPQKREGVFYFMRKKYSVTLDPCLIPTEIIENKILMIRGKKVMLDSGLAQLYEVPTKSLNLAVKRNLARFPEDFMFRLTTKEAEGLRFQFETSKPGRGGRRYLPFVFTQEGVAMLSSVLNSKRAISVNIQIMRVFAKLRELMISHKDLARKIEDLERKYREHDEKFILVFEAIKKLLNKPEEPSESKPPIGFHLRKE